VSSNVIKSTTNYPVTVDKIILLDRDPRIPRKVPHPDWVDEATLWASGYEWVAGIDEVGRGALSGPVVCGIAMFYQNEDEVPSGLKDSKKLSRLQREKLAPLLQQRCAFWGLGESSPAECDQWGMAKALGLAAVRAILSLPVLPQIILLDGPHDFISASSVGMLKTPCTVIPVQDGDLECASIAAASVLAKVIRDNYMREVHNIYPQYEWEHNVGYGSPQHLAAIETFGPCELHRLSWKCFRQLPSAESPPR